MEVNLFTYLGTFFAGVAIEAACVAWVHYSERERPGMTALFSAIVATAQVYGLGESIHDRVQAVCFVFGYATGTYLAVWVKRAMSRHKSQST